MLDSVAIQTMEVADSINSLAEVGGSESPTESLNPETSTSEDSNHEEASQSPEEGGEESPEKGQVLKTDEVEQEDSEKKPAGPHFVATKGEEAIELDEDIVLSFNVDKKEEKISIKDLIRQHQGRIPIEKHMGQLKQEKLALEADRKQFDEDRSVVEKEVGEIVSLLKTNPKKALEKIVLMAGGNPGEYEAIYADELSDMTEREKAVFLREKALEHKEEASKRQESQKKESKEIDESAQLITKTIVEGQQRYKISDDEIKTAWDYVLSQANSKKINFGTMTPQQIGNTVVRHIMENVRPQAFFEKAAREVGWTEAVTGDDINLLKGLLTPDMQWADVADIVRAYYNLSSDSNSDEVQPKTSESSKGGATRPTPPKTPQKPKVIEADEEDERDDDDPISFDDLLRSAQKKRGRR